MSVITNGAYRSRRVFAFEWTVERPIPARSRTSNEFSLKNCQVHLRYSVSPRNVYCVKLVAPPSFPKSVPVTVNVESHGRSLPLTDRWHYYPDHPRIWIRNEVDIVQACPDFLRNGLLTFLVNEVDAPKANPIRHLYKNACLEKLSSDLSGLLEDQDSRSDVVLVCGDRTVNGHGQVLGARSRVLSAMLQSDMSEARTGRIEIKDMHCSVFDQFVLYLYSGKLPELTMEAARGLYEAADKYDVASLMMRCASFMEQNLAPENACEMLVLADAHSDQDFKEAVKDYIIKQEIIREDHHWLPFCNRRPLLANEVLNRYVKRQRII